MSKNKRKKAKVIRMKWANVPAPEPEPLPAKPRIVCVGDIVVRTPVKLCKSKDEKPKPITGRVIYVHPLRRYHVVEFEFPFGGKVRESFLGVER